MSGSQFTYSLSQETDSCKEKVQLIPIFTLLLLFPSRLEIFSLRVTFILLISTHVTDQGYFSWPKNFYIMPTALK